MYVYYRLDQACNHVAALTQNDELLTDTSQTSQPMKWNQSPKHLFCLHMPMT